MPFSTTALRLSAAFGAVLALFALALAVTLRTLDRLDDAQQEVAALDEAKHAGHAVAAAVREQYIHQAHSVIHGDRSHLGHYERAIAGARAAVGRLRRAARSGARRAEIDEIARLVDAIDARFRSRLLPAIDGGDAAVVRDVHDHTEELVARVVERSERVNHALELRSDEARGRAAALRTRARAAEIGCFALAIAIAALVGLLIARSILRPITRLRAGALAIGRGQLATRIAVDGRDEFAELAASFNRMAAELERHQAELVRSQKLAAVGQVAAGVAHEINNPLGVILGYVRLLQREGRVSDEARAELAIVENEVRQCQRVVADLLDLARPPKLRHERVDLATLVREAVERLDETGKLAGLTIATPQAEAPAWGDEAKLRQVVANLLANAADATRPAGAIRVEAASAEGGAVLIVSDTGAGIAAEALPRVFDPFFTTKPDGTGLGLAISQAIVEAHGGTIEVASEPGRGTRVTARLPKGAA